MRRGTLLALALAASALAAGCSTPGGSLAFDAKHVDSKPDAADFVEVWRVTNVREAIRHVELRFTLDGGPLRVNWGPINATVGVGDEFSFAAAAFDAPRHVEAIDASGRAVWKADYRGGTGEDIK